MIVVDPYAAGIRPSSSAHNFGGRDKTYAEHVLDEAPLDAKLDAMRTASLAFDKATRIVERSTLRQQQEAEGVLDALAEGFKIAAAEIRAREGESDATEE